jgi:hypothetical protein
MGSDTEPQEGGAVPVSLSQVLRRLRFDDATASSAAAVPAQLDARSESSSPAAPRSAVRPPKAPQAAVRRHSLDGALPLLLSPVAAAPVAGSGGSEEASQPAALEAEPLAQPAGVSWLALVGRELGVSPDVPGRRPTPDRYKRARVYNTLWGVPRRLEQMAAFAALVCADALLATLVTLPIRSASAAVRLAGSWGGRGRGAPSRRVVLEQLLTDGVLVAIFAVSVGLLYRQDVSVIYHSIRSQEVVKLYVLFSVLELCDKLLQSFGADMLEALAASAAGVAAHLSPAAGELDVQAVRLACLDYLLDAALLTASVLAHALVLLTAAVTLGCAANSHASGTLLAVLLSSNFTEVKGYVFKRMDSGKVSQLVCQDAVERAHLAVLLLFLAAQQVEVHRSLLGGLADPRLRSAAVAVLLCEPLVDVLKHSFMSKFNDIGPSCYANVLQQLASRAQRVQSHQAHLVLGFVPMAPAALLLRALPPAAAAAGFVAVRHAVAALLLAVCAKLFTGVVTRRATAAIIAAHATTAHDGEAGGAGVRLRAASWRPAPVGATPRFFGAQSPRGGSPHRTGSKKQA